MDLSIIVDTREPKHVISALEDVIRHMNNGVQKRDPINLDIRKLKLEAGDFEGNGVVIERKTWDDFFASIVDRDSTNVPRYRSQLVKLVKARDNKKIPVVAVHGDMTSVDDQKRLAILTVMSKYFAAGIPVVCGFPNLHDFFWWVIRTIMYGASSIESIKVDLTKTVKPVKGNPTATMVRSIPDVGPVIANKIADSGLTVYEICSLTIPALSLIISGLDVNAVNLERFKKKPYKIAKKIYEYIRGKDSDYEAEEWQTHPDEQEDEED